MLKQEEDGLLTCLESDEFDEEDGNIYGQHRFTDVLPYSEYRTYSTMR